MTCFMNIVHPFNYSSYRATSVSRAHTAATIISAFIMSSAFASICFSLSIFVSTPIMSVPTTVPKMLPAAPEAVPPITTAATIELVGYSIIGLPLRSRRMYHSREAPRRDQPASRPGSSSLAMETPE